MESEHLITNEKVVGSSPSVFTNLLFRGRLTGRTTGSEPVNMGSTPIPEANQGVPQMARRACLGNKCSQVQILPP